MRVVHQPVDHGRCQGLGHQLVEAGRVQVGADGHAAPFVGGVDQAVEALGGVGAHRQEADVINLCRHRHKLIYAEAATMPTQSR